MHFLLSVYSFCGVLSAGGSYWFVHNISVTFCLNSMIYFLMELSVVIAEKLWSGLENFVFDWLINADRYGYSRLIQEFLELLYFPSL